MIRNFALLLAAMLAGCASTSAVRAPIVDHSVSLRSGGQPVTAAPQAATAPVTAPLAQPEPVATAAMTNGDQDWRPRIYTVRQGDTLYGIAFNFGLDYHDLAHINNLPDPTHIEVGQKLRLFPDEGASPSAPQAPQQAGGPLTKTGPVARILPYSKQAVAQIEQADASAPRQTAPDAGNASAKTAPPLVLSNLPAQWMLPAKGKVIAGFSEGDNRKGIDIAGVRGQPVYASAPGKVIFCGTGLRGYGKLIIIKHNDIYLSAYAHNDALLVKEGQMVAKGQVIAKMGNTDANQVMLHFEIRKRGKPVDPAKFLALPKS